MTTIAEQRQADRHAYLDLRRIASALRLEANGMHAIAAQAFINPEYGDYAERRRDITSRLYEQMGVDLAALADEAQAEADRFFELFTGEPVDQAAG